MKHWISRRWSPVASMGCMSLCIVIGCHAGDNAGLGPAPGESPAQAPENDDHGQKFPDAGNIVESGPDVDVLIGDSVNEFRVVSRANLGQMGDLLTVEEALARDLIPAHALVEEPVAMAVPKHRRRAPSRDSLIVGYPLRLLGESSVVGGVLTKVSDREDEFLGGLKMIQLPPLHVRPFVVRGDDGRFGMALFGCEFECVESSPQEVLLTIPIAGFDLFRKQLMLDISTLGEGLTLDNLFPPEFAGLVEVGTRATFVDYSQATLVFDVESTMERLPPEGLPAAASAANLAASADDDDSLRITTRWYIDLGSRFNDLFAVRDPIAEVGFFTTFRGPSPRITRFATTRYGERAPIRYYIKNVPEAYRDAFSAGFDDWNRVFRDLIGYDLLEYVHIGQDHPLSSRLVAGDVRYNIMEWDVDNLAFYGGLGPSVAHGFTGEIFSATTLIQGPTIIELYSDWFDVTAEAAALRASGDEAGAQRVLAQFQRRAMARQRPAAAGAIAARLGRLELAVPAADPDLHDPLMAPFDFDETPPGVDFDTYMRGYFREISAHELGHNLGLRHNFMGSLSGNGDDVASHSVMEYVVRTERFKTVVGDYDRQAVAYGYAGIVPEEPLPYCTDFEVAGVFAPTLSAECSTGDAGPDPFAYFRDSRVGRAVDLALGRGLGAGAPEWTPEELTPQLQVGLQGMILYATSADATAETWQNFSADPSRPSDPEAIRAYVMTSMYDTICNTDITDDIADKSALNPEAGQIAYDNWLAILAQAQELAAFFALPLDSCELVL